MYQPDHAAHTGQTAHHDDRVQYLVVGDESSLSELEAELAMLPLCARGRVFIETDGVSDVALLAAPMRMTITWLPRAARSGRPGTASACAPGEAVGRAVRAWTAEMLCDGPGATRALLTGDYRTVSAVYDHLIDTVGMAPDAVATPAAFGLRTAH
ncbi:SIP domain-containing protein [Leifsonia sp. Root112D2]|uniref:SIP domain-containing protein n=1 Tax=Leifsonia sp. Root112D2 TaxID=1736426 RepID=UPI0006FFD761|nr:SIP domain-containing protein [Leifsonia sp. Root112D2]KQV05956.1 hypothetical protein ASC63_00125 [Leifsonia sp. Root112D2]